jgi:hypothetical protein
VKNYAKHIENVPHKLISLEKLKIHLSELLGKNTDFVKSVKVSPVENSYMGKPFTLYYLVSLYGETGNKLGEISLLEEEYKKCASDVEQKSMCLYFENTAYVPIPKTSFFLPADQYGYCDDKEEVKRLLALYGESEDVITKLMRFWKDGKTVAYIEYD